MFMDGKNGGGEFPSCFDCNTSRHNPSTSWHHPVLSSSSSLQKAVFTPARASSPSLSLSLFPPFLAKCDLCIQFVSGLCPLFDLSVTLMTLQLEIGQWLWWVLFIQDWTELSWYNSFIKCKLCLYLTPVKHHETINVETFAIVLSVEIDTDKIVAVHWTCTWSTGHHIQCRKTDYGELTVLCNSLGK